MQRAGDAPTSELIKGEWRENKRFRQSLKNSLYLLRQWSESHCAIPDQDIAVARRDLRGRYEPKACRSPRSIALGARRLPNRLKPGIRRRVNGVNYGPAIG